MLQVTADYIKNKTKQTKTPRNGGEVLLFGWLFFGFFFFFHLDLQFWQWFPSQHKLD